METWFLNISKKIEKLQSRFYSIGGTVMEKVKL